LYNNYLSELEKPMAKQLNLTLNTFPNLQDLKKTAHLYRRKLALRLKEILETDLSTDDTQIALETSNFSPFQPEHQQSRK
jgi:hypothetical protein